MSTKTCSKCKEVKDLDKFAIQKTGKQGRSSCCKECKNSWKRNIYNKRDGANIKTLDARFSLGKYASRKRDHEWLLDLETYKKLLSGGCFYCNKEILSETGYSIDRKDSNIGYTIDNSVGCCGDCNIGKSNRFSSEEWIIAMQAIINYRNKVD